MRAADSFRTLDTVFEKATNDGIWHDDIAPLSVDSRCQLIGRIVEHLKTSPQYTISNLISTSLRQLTKSFPVSDAFHEWSEAQWFPPLRARYPLPSLGDATPDAHLIRLLHQGYPLTEIAQRYPAHLHIDLLPTAHGRGWGRKLTEHFLAHLRARGVPALHLGVSRANRRAVGFYETLGFHPVQELPDTILFGLHLEA